jgi:hypothetical protein
MYDSKLVKILTVLSLAERNAFADFVASPFYNKSALLVQLCTYYLGANLDKNDESTEKQAKTLENDTNTKYDLNENDAFAFVYPDKTFDKATLQRLSSRLTKLLEEYIVQVQRTPDAWKHSFALLQFYNERGLNHSFENHLKAVQKEQDILPYRDSRFFFKQYRLAVEISNFESYKQDDYTGDVHFQASNDALDEYYICTKIEQLCLMLNRARATRYPYDYTMLKHFLTNLDNSKYIKNPSIQLWYGGLQLLHEPSAAHHKNLQNLLQKHPNLLPKHEARHLYTYLENTAREVYENDRLAFLNTLFELYETQLSAKTIYTQEGYLHPQTFYNIFVVAIALEKTAWANDFLNEDKTKIIVEYATNDTVAELCSAILALEHRAYDTALSILNNTHFENIYFKMTERRLRLKLYFETQEWSVFESLTNSFRKFLTDSKLKLPETQLQPQRDFVTAIVLLYKIQERISLKQALVVQNQISPVQTLTELIAAQPLLPEKKWVEAHLKTFLKTNC